MNHPEDMIQADIVKALSHVGIYCFMIWNEGGGASAMRTAKAITKGLKPGVSDLEVWFPWGRAYLEVKDAKGKQNPNQVKFEQRCKDNGFEYYVVRSVKDVAMIMFRHGDERMLKELEKENNE